jgi:DNA-binding GntR family transcriptional regulator
MENNPTGPFKKKAIPVSARTYEYLKSRVLSGGFNPGDRLTEEHLAEELGVSRTPIREALHKLELEGLIKSLETRGFPYCPMGRIQSFRDHEKIHGRV